MPSTSPGELESKIQMEHMRYLVAELDVKVRTASLYFFNPLPDMPILCSSRSAANNDMMAKI